jgi:pimeloyl-ACP methyl ester carboxylesterase
MKTTILLLPGLLCDYASWGQIPDLLGDVATSRIVSYGSADTLEAMAAAALSQAPDRFALAGHSMGGRVALYLHHHHPERVSHLGLLSTSSEGTGDSESFQKETRLRSSQLESARRLGVRGFAQELWISKILGSKAQRDPKIVSLILEMMDRFDVETMESQVRAVLGRPDMDTWLSDVKCPALVLSAEDDHSRPPEVHRKSAAAIGSPAKLEIIRDAGHMVMLERPEEVGAAMRTWLARSA